VIAIEVKVPAMNLNKWNEELNDLEQRFRQRNKVESAKSDETFDKVNHDGYTDEDRYHELERFSQELNKIYDPRASIRPFLDDVISIYEAVTEKERRAIRSLCSKYNCASYGLLDYIIECAECLETPEDEDIFRLGMIAASIQNCAHDFRDTSAVLAELALAAVEANINIELHCTAIAELSSPYTPTGGGHPMKSTLANFHVYAPKAVRLF
jgi:hypothetical protein